MAPDHDLVVRNGTVVSPENGRFRADVAALDGTISAIGAPDTLDGDRVVDATGKYVVPGVIDPHTHHGIARDLEADARSESRSGLVGGVTTIGNMLATANRSEPWTDIVPEAFETVEPQYYHDYFLTLAPLNDTHVEEIPYVIEEHGVTGFKWFNNLKQSVGLTEDVADAFIGALSEVDVSTTLGFHSENTEITAEREETLRATDANDYEVLVEAFPGYAEAQSLATGAALAYQHDYDGSFYPVHLSSAEAVEEFRRLRAGGYDLWSETCPHYLALTTEECDGMMKINPPIRGPDDREALWEAVADGTIDCLGSDHCAKPLPSKQQDAIWDVANAFPGSGTLLPLVLSEGVNEGRIPLERAAELTATNPAKAWNLYPKKGTIRVGSDADLAVVDLDESRTVTPELVRSACDYSIYDGMELTGWPTHTVVRGTVVYEHGDVVGEPGHGTHVDRPV